MLIVTKINLPLVFRVLFSSSHTPLENSPLPSIIPPVIPSITPTEAPEITQAAAALPGVSVAPIPPFSAPPPISPLFRPVGVLAPANSQAIVPSGRSTIIDNSCCSISAAPPNQFPPIDLSTMAPESIIVTLDKTCVKTADLAYYNNLKKVSKVWNFGLQVIDVESRKKHLLCSNCCCFLIVSANRYAIGSWETRKSSTVTLHVSHKHLLWSYEGPFIEVLKIRCRREARTCD